MQPHKSRWPALGLWAGSTAVAGGLIALWGWQQNAERRAIGAMAPQARATVFQRARDNFDDLCRDAATAISERCEEQARFLLLFPECMGDCRAQAERWLPKARR